MEINSNSLLAPDYIRESNSFIMEYNFIDHNQMVFPSKSFFQLVNKPEDSVVTSSLVAVSSEDPVIDLNSEYGKTFEIAHVQEDVINSVQSYPSLSLLTTTTTANVINEPIVPDDVVSFRFARKALPHKKRISRKLKSLPAEDQEKRLQFTCEICGHCAGSQIDFFSHLKEHYEPTSNHIIDSLRTTLDEMDAEKDSKKSVEHVFNDVQLNFGDFPTDVEETSPNASNLKLFNGVNIGKCIDFENVDNVASLKNIVNEEIEFSDTEDMLEGIRNVVDKVSIEDSCDEIDLISSNGLRGHWFNNNNFQRIETPPLKSDVSFPSAFAQILDADDTTTTGEPSNTESKYQSTEQDTNKLIDFSTLCSKNFEINDNHPSNCNNPPNNDTLSTSCLDQTTLSCVDDSLSSIDDLDCQISNGKSPTAKLVKSKEKFFYCEECKREFNSGNALKYHKRTHTGIRPHKCNVCERSFFAHSQKISHMRTHTGEKPFQCEFCQQRFRQWGDLKYHTTSIHTEEKSHQCEFCGKAFSRKYSLVIHIRIHENEKNYKCDFCDKAFRASSYLQNHRRIHTGEKPHGCKVCSKRFRVYGDLRRHMRIHQRNVDDGSRIQDLNTINEVNSSEFLQ